MNASSSSDRRCPECGGGVDRRPGEQCCTNCGLVLDSTATGPNRQRVRFRRSRATGPPKGQYHRLSTYVGDCARDSRGRPIQHRKQRRLHRQRRCQRRAASDAVPDSVQLGTSEIDRLGASLSLGEQATTIAKTIFRRAVDDRLLYGRATEAVAGAAVYLACRQGGAHRGLAEVGSLSQVSRRRVARNARHLQRELDLSVEPPAVLDYLPRIRTALGFDTRSGRLARQLLEKAIEANLHSGRDPNGLAASALYTVSVLDERTPARSQRAVASEANVCPETIRRRHRELCDLSSEVLGSPKTDAEMATDNSSTLDSACVDRSVADSAGG